MILKPLHDVKVLDQLALSSLKPCLRHCSCPVDMCVHIQVHVVHIKMLENVELQFATIFFVTI